MADERLPYGKQISPRQIDLRQLLGILDAANGDAKAAHAAIGHAFFPKPGDTRNEVTSGMNAFLAARWYQFIDTGSPYDLTPLGSELLGCEDDSNFRAILGKHLLLNLHGIQLIEVIDALQARGESVTVARVAAELLAIGVDPGGASGENLNPFRLWLEYVGVLRDKWTIDSSTVKAMTGASPEEISELVALPAAHQAVLLALATVTDVPPHAGAKLRELAEAQSGSSIDLKTFAGGVLGRLAADGWITSTKATGGRGAKPQLVAPTDRFVAVISEPLMNVVVDQTHLQDPASLRRPLAELLDIVESSTHSNHDRGLALEGVCIQVVRLLGYRFTGWRVRGDQTGGAEVDVVAETSRPPYELVQVQSKASSISGREIVDREVGVSVRLKSNVVLFISAQKVGNAARQAAASHMQESNLSILFLEGADLRHGIAGITTAVDREWQRVRSIRTRGATRRTQSLDEGP